MRGLKYFHNYEEDIADGRPIASLPAPESKKRDRLLNRLAREVVELKKEAKLRLNSKEVSIRASNAPYTLANLKDPIQEWMRSVPIKRSPLFNNRLGKRSRKAPSSFLLADARTPSISSNRAFNVIDLNVLAFTRNFIPALLKVTFIHSPSAVKDVNISKPL
jgi:hypothetical protein